MLLTDLSIRKPVFAWMLMFGLIFFGGFSFFRMGMSRMPDVDFPVLTVSVSWIGASPETMELAVADVIEDAVMSIEGIRSVTSTCQEGLSNTVIEFELTRGIDAALQEVQTKLAQAQKVLPTAIDPPVVTKSNPEDQPIMWVALTGTNLRDQMLFVRDHLKDHFTTISGVGDVRFGGYVEPNMRIWLNAPKMMDLQISPDDVINAILGGSALTPSGYIDYGPKETNVRVLSEAATPKEFGDLYIQTRNGVTSWKPIPIHQIARVEEGLADIRRISRKNGEQAVGLGIIKQRGSNAVAVALEVKNRLKDIIARLPKAMNLQVVVDSTKFIQEATHELNFTLLLSAILTSVVCWLFLGSWSSALNVILAIPTSLIGTFIVLYFLGFTLNTFTLLALSLSIGIVVDDAIMVLENIVRYHESGKSRFQAALLGAREISGAAIAASLAILAIFLPVVFMKGIIGKFFYQFGVAMSVAVLLSLLEALTLAPMRCSQFLTAEPDNKLTRAVHGGLGRLMDLYHRLLVWALDRRWRVMGLATAGFIASLFLVGGMNKEFSPPQDQSQFLVTVQTPMGSSMEFTNEVFRKIEAFFKARPETSVFYAAIGGFQGGLVNTGNMFVTLKPPGERGIEQPFKRPPTQQEFMTFARDSLGKIPGVTRATVLDLSLVGFSANRGYPVSFSIQGPDWKTLADLAKGMMEKMKSSDLMTDIDTDYNPNMPEIQISPNRIEASRRGVSEASIARTISTAVGSYRVDKYTDAAGHRDDVRIKMDPDFIKNKEDIAKIQVRNAHGELVSLAQVVNLQEKSSLLTINRYNRERTISVFANVKAGKSQSSAMEFVEAESKKLLPDGYHVEMTGSSKTFRESIDSLMVALLLGVLVAYMILGAQFNSFVHPLIVLLALPFSVTGAFIALRLTGISLNIYSMIGMLLLMGIVKKNSILLVDFTNAKMAAGLGVREALLHACPLRLRPILMTSIATITAALPAAFALGSGSETTRPMAVVVIGGVLVSTLLTLVVVPCGYSLAAPFARFGTGDASAQEAREEAK